MFFDCYMLYRTRDLLPFFRSVHYCDYVVHSHFSNLYLCTLFLFQCPLRRSFNVLVLAAFIDFLPSPIATFVAWPVSLLPIHTVFTLLLGYPIPLFWIVIFVLYGLVQFIFHCLGYTWCWYCFGPPYLMEGSSQGSHPEPVWKATWFSIFTRDSVAIARICHGNSVCLSVCPSVCHTGGSVKNGWS